MGEHEVDRGTDGLDPRRLLVGHLDPVGVLELLHERVEVERVRGQVVAEVRRLRDAQDRSAARRPDAPGSTPGPRRGSWVTFAHFWSGKLAAVSDTSARPSAPAPASRSWVRPATSSRTPRAATSIAARTRARRTTRAGPRRAAAARAGRRRPPPRVDLVAQARAAPAQQQPAELRARGRRRGTPDRCQQRRGRPSITFSATLPANPSATTTSAAPVPIANPRRCRRSSARRAARAARARRPRPRGPCSPPHRSTGAPRAVA